jgi:hypothetical protein
MVVRSPEKKPSQEMVLNKDIVSQRLAIGHFLDELKKNDANYQLFLKMLNVAKEKGDEEVDLKKALHTINTFFINHGKEANKTNHTALQSAIEQTYTKTLSLYPQYKSLTVKQVIFETTTQKEETFSLYIDVPSSNSGTTIKAIQGNGGVFVMVYTHQPESQLLETTSIDSIMQAFSAANITLKTDLTKARTEKQFTKPTTRAQKQTYGDYTYVHRWLLTESREVKETDGEKLTIYESYRRAAELLKPHAQLILNIDKRKNVSAIIEKNNLKAADILTALQTISEGTKTHAGMIDHELKIALHDRPELLQMFTQDNAAVLDLIDKLTNKETETQLSLLEQLDHLGVRTYLDLIIVLMIQAEPNIVVRALHLRNKQLARLTQQSAPLQETKTKEADTTSEAAEQKVSKDQPQNLIEKLNEQIAKLQTILNFAHISASMREEAVEIGFSLLRIIDTIKENGHPQDEYIKLVESVNAVQNQAVEKFVLQGDVPKEFRNEQKHETTRSLALPGKILAALEADNNLGLRMLQASVDRGQGTLDLKTDLYQLKIAAMTQSETLGFTAEQVESFIASFTSDTTLRLLKEKQVVTVKQLQELVATYYQGEILDLVGHTLVKRQTESYEVNQVQEIEDLIAQRNFHAALQVLNKRKAEGSTSDFTEVVKKISLLHY